MAHPSKSSNPLKPSAIPNSEYQKAVLDWTSMAVQEGDAFLQAQTGYSKISETIDQIMGEGSTGLSSKLSSNASNHLGRIALSLTAGLTDIKPFWSWETHNKRFERQADINNKLAAQWWTGRMIDQRHADTVRLAVTGGSAYLSPFWDDNISDLNARAEDTRDVLPIRPADNISIQNAVGVIVRRSRSVNYVKMKWPDYAHYIKADRVTPLAAGGGRAIKLIETINKSLSPFNMTLFQGEEPKAKLAVPSVDLMHCYVRDQATNDKKMPIQMGDPRANWSYVVQPGHPMYPRGRMMIFTRTIVLYDGPNIYWHGMFPLAKLSLDPWPWTWLGKAPLWDALPLQKELDKTLRAIGDHVDRVAQPALIADKNSVSTTAWKRINTRRGGLKVLQNMLAGKGAQIIHEPDLSQQVAKYPDWLIDQMEKLTGSKDISSLMQMGQIPSKDTVEKIIQSMSPANRMRSRGLEAFITEFAQMTLSNFVQFYTPSMRVAILGTKGLTTEDFDFAKGNMIPDFLDPADYREDGAVKPEAMKKGPSPVIDRAAGFLRQFRYSVAPGSLLNAASVERKLQYLMLSRMGLIDHWTLLEEMDVPNVGSPPDGADTITKRLQEEAKLGLGPMVNPVGRKATGQSSPNLKMTESS